MKQTFDKIQYPGNVSGVGNCSESATYDCTLPVAFMDIDGRKVSGSFKTPTVSNSDLPGLLVLTALRKNKAVVEFNTLKCTSEAPGTANLKGLCLPVPMHFKQRLPLRDPWCSLVVSTLAVQVRKTARCLS